MERVHRLASDCPMSMAEALRMELSFESIYYTSEAWKMRKSEIEAQHKAGQGIALRLNQLIGMMGGR